MPSYTSNGVTGSWSNPTKDSNGNVSITVTLKNNSGLPWANCRVSFSTTDSSPWTRADVGTLQPGQSRSTTVTISTGSTSQSTIYGYVLTGSESSGSGGAFTAYGYTPPTPSFEKKILYISPNNIEMGEKLSISESSGVGVSSVSRRWSCGNSTGDFNTGQWKVPIEDFEPLTPNANSIVATFTTYSSGSGGSGSSSVNVTLRVPENYLPTANHEYQFIDAQNNALVAGYSKLKLTIIPGLVPEDNHATISSCELLRINTTNPQLTVESFTNVGNVYTSVLLPTLDGVPSYNFSLVFKIIDSRGNQLEYTTNTFRVTNFIPPYVNITNLKRETATKGTINISINSPSSVNLATIKVGEEDAIDVKDNLVETSTGYTLDYEITGLQSGTQYQITFSYQDENMYNYGERPYSYTRLLSTLEMPLSMYDDGSKIYISFGEECSDDYGVSLAVNFAKNIYLRYIDDDDTIVCKKVQDLLGACPYEVGDILQTIDDTDPSDRWEGTEWQQLEGRVLVGVGTGTDVNGISKTFDLEEEGGEYEHILTVDELPSHSHTYQHWADTQEASQTADLHTVANNSLGNYETSAIGGNQGHNNVQPYYGVYMWLRTA